MSTVGLAFVLYLAWASYTQLHTFCLLCAITYVSVIALFIISGGATTFPMTTLPRRVPRDARALFSSPAAIVIILLFLFGAGTLIAYFPSEAPRQAPMAIKPLPDEEKTKLAQWFDLQPVAQPAIPNEGAKVLVAIFSDYQCPHCRMAHDSYKPLVAKYAGDPRVKFVLKHFPLESECNPNSGNVHSASCEAAAAVVMAKATGKAAQMDAWLFDHQDELTPSGVRDAGKDIGGIADFNGGYAEALKQVRADAVLGGQLGVSSTPTIFLNGRKLGAGVVDPSALDALIELELKRAK
jgi:protein-disulfide isomerase